MVRLSIPFHAVPWQTILLLFLTIRVAVVHAGFAEWTWSRTEPTDGTYFASTPDTTLSITLSSSAAIMGPVMAANTWYKLVAYGSYWTGADESDMVCFYMAVPAHHCNGRTTSTYGIFSNELGLTCSIAAQNPIMFWKGQTSCPAYSASANTEYTVYIKTTYSNRKIDWFLKDVDYTDNALATSWTSSSGTAEMTYRRGLKIAMYKAIAPETVTSTTTATATLRVTQSVTAPPVTVTATRTKGVYLYAVGGGWGKDLTTTNLGVSLPTFLNNLPGL
ncbi:hypothetical protein DFJ77DRAFT_472281 [Powellomyces hirtus]|nr:hypothetical protein DFJ77DRAFT_472281 [Powellomyces hirtus]